MDDKQKMSTANSKYSAEKIDSDIDDKKKDNPETSKHDSAFPLEKNNSDTDGKRKNKPETPKNNSKSSLEENDSDIDDKKEVKPETPKDNLKSSLKEKDSDINATKKPPEVMFKEPVVENYTPEVMFEPLSDLSEESDSKAVLKTDDNDSIEDIKEEQKTSKDMFPPIMEDEPDDISKNIVESPLNISDTNKTQIPERHSKPAPDTSTTQESPKTFESMRQNNSQNGKEDKSFGSTEIPMLDNTSEESSEGEGKKRVSITEDAVGQPVRKQPKRWKAEARPSTLRRKFAAFEKQLTIENINKRVTSMFVSDSSKGDSDGISPHSEDAFKDKKWEKPERSYLSPTMAIVFIISICTGYSIISLPFYLKKSNWFGVFLIILLGLNAMYSGLCTGWSWIIMEELWPEYQKYSQTPYQDIGYRAAGKIMKYFIAVCIDVSVLLSGSLFLILIADSFENITYDYIPFCYVLIIVTVFLLPFSMYGAYRNIKFIAIVDAALSILYLFILIVCLFLDRPLSGTATYKETSFNSLISSFGGFSFAYGVGPPLANVLIDMEDRTMFTNACASGFLVVIIFYVTLAIMGYAAYGDATTPYILQKILTNKTFRPLGIFLDCIYIIQIMTSFIIFLLPSLLQFEVRVNCPDRFGLWRVLVRLVFIGCMLALVLGVPSVTEYLEFLGATSINLLTFILPPICYVLLIKKLPKNSKRKIYKKEWVVIIESIVLGIAVFIVSILIMAKEIDVEVSLASRTSCFLNMSDIGKAKQWMWTRRT